MLGFNQKKVMIFASVTAAFLIIVFMNLLKFRDESITGNVIVESTGEKASIHIIFILIAVVVGALLFLTIMYRQYHRY